MTDTRQHTPGPWEACSPRPDGKLDVYLGTDEAGDSCATVCGARAEANARLIAAAPELLDFVRVIAQGSGAAVVGGARRRQAWELMNAVSGPIQEPDGGER